MDEDALLSAHAAREVANAVNMIVGDIIKNTGRVYPKGHPIVDLPSVLSDMERSLKRGNLADAQRRAVIADKLLGAYAPSEETPRVAKELITQRVRDILAA